MESIMEILAKIAKYYKTKSNAVEQEDLADDPKYDDEKIKRFQSAMKEVIKETDNEHVKSIAQTFYDNPVESMKMLQSIVSEQAIKDTKELITLTEGTSKMLNDIKSSINMSDPRALDQIATINTLHSNEQMKLKLANNILGELRPLEKESEANIEQIDTSKSHISTAKVEEAKGLLNRYFKSLNQEEQDQYSNGVSIDYSEEKRTLVAQFDSKSDPGYSSKKIRLNLETGKGEDVNYRGTEVKGSFESEEFSKRNFSIEDLRKIKENDNNMSLEQSPELEQSKSNSRTKSHEMDGPER